jgi:hypothetical protein
MYDLCTQFLQFLAMSEIHIFIIHCIALYMDPNLKLLLKCSTNLKSIMS